MEGIFSLGSNGSGQLGIGHREDVSVPKQVLFESEPEPSSSADDDDPDSDPVVKVAAGGNHTILLTRSGKAYWSGDGTNGCCGARRPVKKLDADGDDANDLCSASASDSFSSCIFKRLRLPASQEQDVVVVTNVACTWDTTVLVLRDGKTQKPARLCVLGGGGGGGGVSGLDNFPPEGTQIVDLAAGFRHVVVVLDNGDVYGWGHNRKGQLGGGEGGPSSSSSSSSSGQQQQQTIITSPTKIQGIKFPVHRAVCCQYSTCLIAEPGDGTILVLGADKWNLRTSAPIAVPDWKTITAGWGNVYILKYGGGEQEEQIIAWGRDDHGQLPPPGLPPRKITHLAAGSEHCLALSADEDGGQQLLAWGWGEHGNCGPILPQDETAATSTSSSSNNDVVKSGGGGGGGDGRRGWNVIASLSNLPQGSEMEMIGAGCATSWVRIVNTGGGIFL